MFYVSAVTDLICPCSLTYLWMNNFNFNTQLWRDIRVSRQINPSVLSFSSSRLAVSFISPPLSLSLSTGVIFPLYCVCGVHHAAVLHAGRHHCKRPDLCLSHPRIERLALPDSQSNGTSGVAGKVLTKLVLISQLSDSVGTCNVAVHCCDFSSFPCIQSTVFSSMLLNWTTLIIPRSTFCT